MGNGARIRKPNDMKHFSLIRHLALACGAAAAALLASCSTDRSPVAAANQFMKAGNVTVFSYNDSGKASTRSCSVAGPLPSETARAIEMWLRQSTVKSFSYVYPQYYIAMTVPGTNKQRVWGICSDGQGNLVGILAPRDGVAAWDLPYRGAYKMYVCTNKNRKAISDAIMETLADVGYDEARLSARRSRGLLEDRYLISKPLADNQAEHLRRLQEQEEASAKAAEERKQAAAKAALEAQNASDDDEDGFSSDDDDSSSSDSDSSSDDDEDEDDEF